MFKKLYALFLYGFFAWLMTQNLYAELSCAENEYIINYNDDPSIYKNTDDYISAKNKLNILLEALPRECAKKMIGMGVDPYLFQAGFLDLLQSSSDYDVISALLDIMGEGDYNFFIKNRFYNLIYIKNIISKNHNNNVFDGISLIYDFILASKYASQEEYPLNELEKDMDESYDEEIFLSYLPVWQSDTRRNQFKKLYLREDAAAFDDKACDRYASISVKWEYIKNDGDLRQTILNCGLSLVAGSEPPDKAINNIEHIQALAMLRRIGILKPYCSFISQFKYIEQHGLETIGDMVCPLETEPIHSNEAAQ